MATSSVHRSIPLRKRLGTSRVVIQPQLIAADATSRPSVPPWPELPAAARANALGALAALLATAALNDAEEGDGRD